MNLLIKKVTFALKKYNMLTNGDSLAVLVSGGKDSLTLLQLLAQIKPYFSEKFTAKAIVLDILVKNIPKDYTKIEDLCKKLSIPCYVLREPLWEIVFVRRKEKNPCSLCSKMRKGILNDAAVKLGCNKVALGHNFDDVVETLAMNVVYGSRFGCFSPVTYLSNSNITMIRPLIFCKESQTLECAKKMNLPVIPNNCPANHQTSRQRIKELLALIEKDFSVNLKQNIFRSFLKFGLNGW